MERESLLAGAHSPPVERTTIYPYTDGESGPLYYQRAGHAVGVEAERLIGALEGGTAGRMRVEP